MGQKRAPAPPVAADKDDLAKWQVRFPTLVVCGSASQYYKCNPVLDYIKELQETTFEDGDDFQKQLVSKLNKLHLNEVKGSQGSETK